MKILKFLFSIYGLLTFILVMFIALPFILIGSCFGVKGGNFIYKVCKVWAFVWYCTIGIIHKNIYEKPHNKDKQYIFVANHVSYLDIPPIVLCVQQAIRVLGKYEMVKIPIFGWVYKATVILVDRSSPEKRSKSVRALKAALNKGISIFLFPEGTFNESDQPLKSFFDGAFKLAIENQTPLKPLLMIDTLERMHFKSVFSLTPGYNRVVFLDEIDVSSYTINDVALLRDLTYKLMDEGLRRYRTYKA
jgi:1-acyl-sn-glycerol-3-phosphate acyltransferase